MHLSNIMNFTKIVIESKSQAALQHIQKSTQNQHWLVNTLLTKIMQLCKNKEIRLVHVFRECNTVAEFMAKKALTHQRSLLFEPGDIPIPARQLAYKDKTSTIYSRKVTVQEEVNTSSHDTNA